MDRIDSRVAHSQRSLLNRTLWIRAGCIALAVLMSIVLFAGARAIGEVNNLPPLAHRIEHFLYYGTMAALIAYALGQRFFWLAIFTVPLIGALDEWHQFYVPNRNSSALDWSVDVFGTVVAVGMVYWWLSRKGVTERRDG